MVCYLWQWTTVGRENVCVFTDKLDQEVQSIKQHQCYKLTSFILYMNKHITLLKKELFCISHTMHRATSHVSQFLAIFSTTPQNSAQDCVLKSELNHTSAFQIETLNVISGFRPFLLCLCLCKCMCAFVYMRQSECVSACMHMHASIRSISRQLWLISWIMRQLQMTLLGITGKKKYIKTFKIF